MLLVCPPCPLCSACAVLSLPAACVLCLPACPPPPRVAKSLMKFPGDTIVMVFVQHARASFDEARALLDSFNDPLYEHQIKRKAVVQVGARDRAGCGGS